MQLLSCHIAVAGDDDNIVVRDHDTAVTYPELLVLRALHGAESVRHVADFGDVERDAADERHRLSNLYGREIVNHVFPGEHVELPVEDRKMRPKKAAAAVVTDDVLEPPDDKHDDRHPARSKR